MRRAWIAIAGVALALLAAPAPAAAAPGDLVCELRRGDTLVVRVLDNGNDTYRVAIIDMVFLGMASASVPDSYAPLPTSPLDLRYGQATVLLSPGVSVVPGSIALSQGVTVLQAPNGNADPRPNRDPAPPGEAAVVSSDGRSVAWKADLDIRTTPLDGRSVPSSFAFPWDELDRSASVLEFDVAVPAGATGALPVLDGFATTFIASQYSVATDTHLPLASGAQTRQLPGCSVPAALRPLPPPGAATRSENTLPATGEGFGAAAIPLALLAAGAALAAVPRRRRRTRVSRP